MFRLLNLKVKKRSFGYQPRYYDADKEALEQRIQDRENQNKDGAITKSRLKQEFSSMRGSNARKGANSNFFRSASFYRLVIIIIVLLFASYYVLNTWLPQFIDMLFPEGNVKYETLPVYQEDN